MSEKKLISGYKVSPGYRLATVWHFDARTKERVGVDTCRPLPHLDRAERYNTIARFLAEFAMCPQNYTP